MTSVNKVILIGNLGKDPEVSAMGNGASVCTLSVATTRNWKNRDTGERQEETEWHRVVLYEQRADFAGEYLRKGRSVYVEGRLKTRKWQDKEGVDRYTTEIIADDIKPLGARDQGDDGDGDGQHGRQQGQYQGGGRDGGGQQRGQGQGQQRQQPQGQQRGNGGGYGGGGGYGAGNGRGAPQGGRSSASGRAPAAAGYGEDPDDIPFALPSMSMESKLERRIHRRNGRVPMSSIEG